MAGGGWYSAVAGDNVPTQLPPPPGYVPSQYTSDEYLHPTEGPSLLFDGKYISLKMWTDSVLGISIQNALTYEWRHKNAFSPSGKSELFDISIDTSCFFTWHPVNDVLARDTELIAWV